jgi:ribosome-binding protein aMBF1 (putative translation factor)
MIARPRPIAETSETVTYVKADIDQLFERLEELEARAAYVATRGEEKLPAAVVQRLCRGESPIRVFREHRGLSTAELAARAGLSQSDLNKIEGGERAGPPDALSSLAAALDVTVADLVA